jgi:hypothetical protein
MKYVLVTGGVISGVGKGVIASSFGAILKSCGIHVTSIKIDPYINIDAGTFSPYEHGEVYVLDDGGEVDLDLGNYERFLDVILHKDNNITTGRRCVIRTSCFNLPLPLCQLNTLTSFLYVGSLVPPATVSPFHLVTPFCPRNLGSTHQHPLSPALLSIPHP